MGGRGSNPGGGGGLSRAAKKRAKKRQKNEQEVEQSQRRKVQQAEEEEGAGNADAKHVGLECVGIQKKRKKKQSKKKKLELPLDDSDDEEVRGGYERSGKAAEVVDVSGERREKKSVEEKKKKKRRRLEMKGTTSSAGGDDESEGLEGDGEKDEENDGDERKVESNENRMKAEKDDDMSSIFGSLTPAQILFPEDGEEMGEEDECSEKDAASTAADPKLLVRDLTAACRARCVFNSILRPSGLTADEFYEEYWEKKPLLITGSTAFSSPSEQMDGDGDENDKKNLEQNHRHRLDGFLSFQSIKTLIAQNALRYGRDLNITRYDDSGGGVKRRSTLDLLPSEKKKATAEGDTDEYIVAEPNDVWSNFDSGCTIRLLCPQEHSDAVHSLLSTLESEFHCMVGSNMYLTPPSNSQGFAPHYDDIEAFILQLEGRKRWRVYAPLNRGEVLPRVSSRDYDESELEGIDPVLDCVLEEGDVLYMPRGWIHQAHTLPKPLGKESRGHSLHLTVSAMQNWAWSDLLELIVPEALDAASGSETSASLREGLPRDFLGYMGAMNVPDDVEEEEEPASASGAKKKITASTVDEEEKSVNEDERNEGEKEEGQQEDGEEEMRMVVEQRRLIRRQREKFKEEARKRIMRVCREAMSMLDAGCDQIGKRYLSDCLPPALTPAESSLTSENRAETGGKVWPTTMCRLVRPNAARLVVENNNIRGNGDDDEKAVLYHCVDNARRYHGNPLSPLEFELDDAPALEMLLKTVEPHWVCVRDLVHEGGGVEDKMAIAQALYDEGMLAIWTP